jgi:hypothetical protein
MANDSSIAGRGRGVFRLVVLVAAAMARLHRADVESRHGTVRPLPDVAI